MPEFDMTVEITNQIGVVYPSGDNPSKSLTLGETCANALALPIPNDVDSMKKMRKGALSIRIADHMRNGATEPFHLAAEDIALLKECIGAAFAPVVVYRALTILDPPPTPKPPAVKH